MGDVIVMQRCSVEKKSLGFWGWRFWFSLSGLPCLLPGLVQSYSSLASALRTCLCMMLTVVMVMVVISLSSRIILKVSLLAVLVTVSSFPIRDKVLVVIDLSSWSKTPHLPMGIL